MNEIYTVGKRLMVSDPDDGDEVDNEPEPESVVCIPLGFGDNEAKIQKVVNRLNKGQKKDEYGNRPYSVVTLKIHSSCIKNT